MTASVGQRFALEVKTSSVSELAKAPFVLTFDPIFVEFISATEGAFLKKDGAPTTFSITPDAAAGTVTVNLARWAGSGGVSGDGSIASLLFRAKKQGPAGFGFRNVGFSTAEGRQLTVLPFSTAVEIK